jgi:hypothetical protein
LNWPVVERIDQSKGSRAAVVAKKILKWAHLTSNLFLEKGSLIPLLPRQNRSSLSLMSDDAGNQAL